MAGIAATAYSLTKRDDRSVQRRATAGGDGDGGGGGAAAAPAGPGVGAGAAASTAAETLNFDSPG